MMMKNMPEAEKSHDPFRKYLWQGFAALFLLVVVMGGWASLAKINGAIIAPGTVIVESKPKTLQHLDGGIVGEILVKNGDKVEEGDVVLRLNPTAMDANQKLVEKRFFEALARADRLKSEWEGSLQIAWSPEILAAESRPEIAEIVDGQSKLFDARKKAYRGQVAQLNQRILQSEEQIAGLEGLIKSKYTQLNIIGDELSGLRELLAKGYVSKPRLLALEREQARLGGEISTHRSDIARTRSAIGETEIQILQLKKDTVAQVLGELREAESQLSDLTEQLVTASDQLARIDIISPVTGVVHDLSVNTIGGVITPGQPIMQIVPANERLVIEARISPVDIDQVYIGQPANVNLSAFNRRTTPQFSGAVEKFSADSLVDQITGAPYFSVWIVISPEELEKLGELTLLPGMPAEAFLTTDKRTVMSFLVKPFKDQLSHSFREE